MVFYSSRQPPFVTLLWESEGNGTACKDPVMPEPEAGMVVPRKVLVEENRSPGPAVIGNSPSCSALQSV